MFDEGERQSAEKALAYMDLRAGHGDARHRGRHRLRRLVHQRPDRGSAGRRRRAARPQGRRRRADAGRARLDAGARAGRIRRAGRDLHRRGRGVAAGRLLDVPRHEPRSARAGGALRVDVQPKFRGQAGQGRPHPSGVACRRRRHRGARHAVLPGRSARRPRIARGDRSWKPSAPTPASASRCAGRMSTPTRSFRRCI